MTSRSLSHHAFTAAGDLRTRSSTVSNVSVGFSMTKPSKACRVRASCKARWRAFASRTLQRAISNGTLTSPRGAAASDAAMLVVAVSFVR